MSYDDAAAIEGVKSFLAAHPGDAALTASDGASARLPGAIRDVIAQAAAALAAGSAVTVAPVSPRLSTAQAAQVLGVSRPTLVKMLESGKIPFDRISAHRTVLLADVLAFRDRRRAEQRQALAELTEQAQAYGLYEDSIEDYADVLEAARRPAAA